MNYELIVEDAVRKLVNRFKGRAFNFFTESDIHSYTYHCLYKKDIAKLYPTKDGSSALLLHREYPTFFRFGRVKKKLAGRNASVFETGNPAASRGHYDLAILNPEFLRKNILDVVINKDIRYSSTRVNVDYNILAAIEFKFIVKEPSMNMLDEIQIDIDRLSYPQDHVRTKYLIIFNNYGPLYEWMRKKMEEMCSRQTKVKIVYIESYLKDNKKIYGGTYFGKWNIKCPIKEVL
jgi:hypothetical protein